MSDRQVRFPGDTWQAIEALPQPVRWTVQRTIFHLLDDPAPTLADPFLKDDPITGTYELHLPADNVTIWYRVTTHEGQEIGWPSRRLSWAFDCLPVAAADRCLPGLMAR